MKIILSLSFIMLIGSVSADDDYSHMVYTATSFMYWCKYNEVAKDVNDFAKVTNVIDSNPKLTFTISDWFKTVKFKIDGSNLKVIRKSETTENGVTTNRTTTTTSNCASHL